MKRLFQLTRKKIGAVVGALQLPSDRWFKARRATTAARFFGEGVDGALVFLKVQTTEIAIWQLTEKSSASLTAIIATGQMAKLIGRVFLRIGSRPGFECVGLNQPRLARSRPCIRR